MGRRGRSSHENKNNQDNYCLCALWNSGTLLHHHVHLLWLNVSILHIPYSNFERKVPIFLVKEEIQKIRA